MKVLINERLSEHKYKTPEGYLICQDAILARTGKQIYRRNEVFNDSSEEEVEVDRKPEQVFSPQTLASFENKPVTVEHPDEDVNPNNYKEYSVGFVRDVHKGVADGQDVILGTLVITDAKTIEEIENGEHTELSCGYDCDIEDNDAPEQKNIRGNHVALCEQGRAGIARIVDSIEDAEENYNDLRKRILNTKNNKDEFEGILNRIERSKSAGAISDIEGNLLKRFWNEKKEQYYPKNPVAKVEGVIIKYVDGTDKKEKYIRVKSGSVSKAKGIYMALRAKNPKKYSYDYGIIPAAGSSQQEWKPFMETHPNVKFEEVYDMKTKDDFSTKSRQGYSVERLERANSGRYYAILKRAYDYVVAAGYDLKDGTWGQGYYDYKTYEDALKGLKRAKTRAGDSVKDAMPVYEIRWIDLIEKSKGHPDYKYIAEIKANTLREALRKLHDRVVLAGTGSRNCLVMNVKRNGKTYMYSGRLDELLKQNPQDSKGIKTKELD